MRSHAVLAWLALAICCSAANTADELPKMKFNEVKEIAPGVFFRYSVITPDDSLPFGGSNNIWVVFEDYVVVIDANFPKEAGDVVEAIKKTTDKPIRYVLDTHHHGDHSYGNAVFGKAGASVVAQANCARLLRVDGPREFAEAGRGPNGRKDIAASTLKVPNVVFDDKLVLDDGKQRVEFLFFGHAHTAGDACAYLPKHKILCTGDACVNGAYNFMGHSDSASWIRALERMQQLDVALVAPGHGPVAGKDLLERQKRYFVELRREVKKGIDARKGVDDIIKDLDLPWYKEWTTVKPAGANVTHVYNELTGRIAPWDLREDFGVYEGPSPTKDEPGWQQPRRIVVPSGLMPARLEELKLIAPKVEFIPARGPEEAAKVVGDADAVVGIHCTPELVRAGKNLRWVQVDFDDADAEAVKALRERKVALTDPRRLDGPPAADQAFALLLALTRGIDGKGPDSLTELHGKTLLLVGLGGTGAQIARRADAFGMRVRAIDDRETERPSYVFSLDRPDKLGELLPSADAVILAAPLTESNRGLIGAKQLAQMKPSAYLVNVGSGALVSADALAEALKKGQVAGAGLDATSPSPLPASHPLRQLKTAVFTENRAGKSPETAERRWRLYRENVRRFVAGEKLLGVVDPASGS
jgi:phosphoglycerate dehydrogenase-like enzyme/glyoxylase-like metal-dependent hydrolase (beta-lactamase superfamily II)